MRIILVVSLLLVFFKTMPSMAGLIWHDWCVGQDGFGYCCQFDAPLGGPGRIVENEGCEGEISSYYEWGDNGKLCYQFTPDGYVMNEGFSVPNKNCESE